MSRYLDGMYIGWQPDEKKIKDACLAAGLDPEDVDMSDILCRLDDVFSDDYGSHWYTCEPTPQELAQHSLEFFVAKCEEIFDREIDSIIAGFVEERDDA